jgi:uncharacterized membrane protein
LTDCPAPASNEEQPLKPLNVSPSEESDLDRPLKKDRSSSRSDEQRVVMASMSFSGPIPSPHVLKAYDLIEPGLAKDIVEMAKAQSKHRMQLESTVINGDGRRAWGGLIFGFVISCLALGGGIYLIDRGHDKYGALISTGSLGALVGIFVYGSNNRRAERKEKIETLTQRMKGQEDKED